MDPNAALAALRKYAADTGGAFAEQFEALDGWLSKGGFLPAAWQQPRTALDQIHELMSGQEWSPDTLDAVAMVLNAAGYEVLDVDEGKGV